MTTTTKKNQIATIDEILDEIIIQSGDLLDSGEAVTDHDNKVMEMAARAYYIGAACITYTLRDHPKSKNLHDLLRNSAIHHGITIKEWPNEQPAKVNN